MKTNLHECEICGERSCEPDEEICKKCAYPVQPDFVEYIEEEDEE